MKKMMMKIAGALALTFGLALGAQAEENLVVNGSFEEGFTEGTAPASGACAQLTPVGWSKVRV